MDKAFILNSNIAPGQAGIFYLGQVGYLIGCNGKYVLIDGYLSDYVDKNCSSELVNWVRRYEPPIKAEELDFVDYVFCTHAHYDHADPETLKIISETNKKARFFCSQAIVNDLLERGVPAERLMGLKADSPFSLSEGISVTLVPSARRTPHGRKRRLSGSRLPLCFRQNLSLSCRRLLSIRRAS